MKKIASLTAGIRFLVIVVAGSSGAYAWMGPLDTIDGPYWGGPGYGWGYPDYNPGRPWSGYSSTWHDPTYGRIDTGRDRGRPWRAYRYPLAYPGYGWGAPGTGRYPGLYGLPFPGAIYPIITDD